MVTRRSSEDVLHRLKGIHHVILISGCISVFSLQCEQFYLWNWCKPDLDSVSLLCHQADSLISFVLISVILIENCTSLKFCPCHKSTNYCHSDRTSYLHSMFISVRIRGSSMSGYIVVSSDSEPIYWWICSLFISWGMKVGKVTWNWAGRLLNSLSRRL